MRKLYVLFAALSVLSWAAQAETKFEELEKAFSAAIEAPIKTELVTAYAGTCYTREPIDANVTLMGKILPRDSATVQNMGMGAVLVRAPATLGPIAILIESISRKVARSPSDYTDLSDPADVYSHATISSALELTRQFMVSPLDSHSHSSWLQSLKAAPDTPFLMEARVAQLYPAGTGSLNGGAILVKDTVHLNDRDFLKYCEFHVRLKAH